MVCKNAAHKYWLSLKLGFCKKKKSCTVIPVSYDFHIKEN